MRQRYQYTVDVPVLQALVRTAHAYEVDQELVAGLRLSFPFNPMLRLWDFNKGKLTLKPCAGCKQPPGFICLFFFSKLLWAFALLYFDFIERDSVESGS